jgi:hypothetical protein
MNVNTREVKASLIKCKQNIEVETRSKASLCQQAK